MRTDFSYSTQGILYKKESYSNNEIIERQTWDPKKAVQMEHSFWGHGGLLNTAWTFKYEYDAFDNWTRQIMYKNDIPERILEREIEYYQ